MFGLNHIHCYSSCAEYISFDEKRKTLKHWISFIKNGFPFHLFTEAIYNHLHLHSGYIAHYNRLGFYETCWNPDTIAYAKENSLEIRPVPEIFPHWENFLKQFEAWGEYRDLGLSMMFALKGELEILMDDLMTEAMEIYKHDMQNSYQLYLDRKAELRIIIAQLKEQTTKKEYELAPLPRRHTLKKPNPSAWLWTRASTIRTSSRSRSSNSRS